VIQQRSCLRKGRRPRDPGRSRGGVPRTGRRLRIAVRSLKSLENRPRRGRRFSYSRFQAAALPVPRAKSVRSRRLCRAISGQSVTSLRRPSRLQDASWAPFSDASPPLPRRAFAQSPQRRDLLLLRAPNARIFA